MYKKAFSARITFALFLLLIGLTASSCLPKKNLILGKWKPKQDGRSMISARNLEFTEEQMILGDGRDEADRIPVKYVIEDNAVSVIPQAGATGPMVCTPTEGDTLTCNMQVLGKVVYVRREK